MEDSRDYKSNPILIGLAVIGGLCILIWALSNFVIDFEFITLNFADIRIRFIGILFFIIVILTAQFVYIDANNIDAGEAYPEQRTLRAMTWSPASWGVLVFFIWFIMFPLYLYKREEIFWQNISVEYSALKTIERDIKTVVSTKRSKRPAPPKKEYSENIGICPTCDTPYPLRMLERSKFCSRCGGLLVKNE